jgi:acetyl/propionyl-CoA carboxylase alpha subunit
MLKASAGGGGKGIRKVSFVECQLLLLLLLGC